MLQEIFAHLGFSFDGAGVAAAQRAVGSVTTGAKQAVKATDALAKQFEELVKFLSDIGPAVGILAIGNKIFQMTEGFVTATQELDNFSQQVGISAQQLQVWRYAATISSLSAEDLDQSLRRMSQGISEAGKGAGEFSDLFSKMEVSVKDGSGGVRTLEELLPDIVAGFSKIPVGVEQTDAAIQLFGRSGTKMIPLLQKGKEGLVEMAAEFGGLGDVLSEKTLRETEEFEHAGNKLSLVFKTLKDRMVMWLVPALTKLGEWVEKGLKAFKSFDNETGILSTGMKIFGLFLVTILIPALWTAATAVYALLAPFGMVALAVAAVYLVLDDLYTLFAGGDSEIGKRLDQWFGGGTTAKVVEWGKAVVKTFQDWAAAFPPIGEWWAKIKAFFEYLNNLSWTEFWDSAKKAGQEFLDWVLTIPKKISDAFGAIRGFLGKLPGPSDAPLPPPKKPASATPGPEDLMNKPLPAPTAIGGSSVDTVAQIQNLLGNVQAAQGVPTLPAPAGPRNSTENNVNVGPTTVNIQIPAGTPAKQVAETGKVVKEAVDNRNRQALQSLEFSK